jgi:hypothetical protein
MLDTVFGWHNRTNGYPAIESLTFVSGTNLNGNRGEVGQFRAQIFSR